MQVHSCPILGRDAHPAGLSLLPGGAFTSVVGLVAVQITVILADGRVRPSVRNQKLEKV